MPKKNRQLKQAIAVYSPEDPLERVIQEQYHNATGEWMHSYGCRLFKKAIVSLKIFDDWLERPSLLPQRISYFFNPAFIGRKKEIVFPTQPVYVPDILENQEINGYLHSPSVFITRSLAHYLFREYPVHIYFDYDKLKSCNDVKFVELGGLVIVDEEDVNIDGALIKMDEIEEPLQKAASIEIERGIFKIDEHRKPIKPDVEVWDKDKREKGIVSAIEPGENGYVSVKMPAEVVVVPKKDFDTRFVYAAQVIIASSDKKTYPINIDGREVKMNDSQIGEMIREKLKHNPVMQKLFQEFKIDIKQLDNLRIEICSLKDKYAETNEQFMRLNESMFRNGDFFDKYFDVVVPHEIFHFLNRENESRSWLNDQEERHGFVVSILYLLSQGKSMQEIRQEIFPKIKWHFYDRHRAEQVYKEMLTKAHGMFSQIGTIQPFGR